MILLNKEDIKSVFTMKDAIEADKECYRLFNEGKFDVPLRAVINGSHGNFLFMPAYSEEMGAAGLKIVNIMPGNTAKGLPASIGQVLLIDGETGVVKALMDGTYVTALRTGAASGAAFDLFGRKDARIGAIIGTGSQAMCQLEAMLTARPLEEVRIAARNFDKTKAFVEMASKEMAPYGAKIVACEDTNAAVDGADLVTLVTVSGTPVCSAEYFKPGCTISAVGAYTYDMQELDPAVFAKCSKIYFDSVDAVLSESGDILRPLDEGTLSKDQFTGDIGEFLLGKIPGRESDDEIIVFENVGMGALDLVAAQKIYARAAEAGVGVSWE
ncbi:MAG: ornithine cyclodeaminase family protein [Mogibacterium sp.]|nr:ornithine cyclodeaminase family protein [Mogibacterium sp.]